MPSPIVYIIMPCYNGETYLLEQLMSIYYQNYTNRYLIFINDGSTDKSENILRDWITTYNLQKKVKVINQENGGVNSAINSGLKEVKILDKKQKSLIAFCDCDDIRTRNKLSSQIDYMASFPDCGLTYHDMAQINENGEIIKKSILKYINHKDESFFALAVNKIHFTSTEMIFKSEYIDNILPLPLGYSIGQDQWTALNLSLIGIKIGYIDKQLAYYRKHQNNLSNTITKKGINKVMQERLGYLKLIQQKNQDINISYEISYIENRYINRQKKNLSRIQILTIILFKYPKIFVLLLKDYLFDNILIYFK